MKRSKVLKGIGLVVLILVIAVGGWASLQISHIFGGKGHGDTPSGSSGFGQTVGDIMQVVGDPYQGFSGQDKVVILGMGIDDNWTDKDEVYTRAARTDTLFLLTLYLKEHRATMLSIPRDTYTHIAGTSYSTKINSAYSTGGPLRSIATVAELTGIRADHYMVLNIDATKKMVDALGGVDVNVEHEMHYHDKWGHLSIDLYPGLQHLDGDKAVGFVRYRHPDAGAKPSPEDGDVRRTERQHIMLRAMAAKAKSFVNITQVGSLIDTGMQQIHTDMTRTQLMDLAAIYRNVQPDDIVAATLPGEDFRGPGGAWDFRLYPDQMKAYVDWLVKGDETAVRRLTPVVVKNGTPVPGLAAHAAAVLRSQGYVDVRIEGNERPVRLASQTSRPAVALTELLDTGVPDPKSSDDIKTILNTPSALSRRNPNKPNRLGWTAPSALTLILGQDYAQQVQAAGGISAGESASSAPVSSTDAPGYANTARSAATGSVDTSTAVPVSNEPAPQPAGSSQ